jgi:hypothetical protein
LCKINFESQTRKEVDFQSSLLISNNSQYTITLLSRKDEEQHIELPKQPSKVQLKREDEIDVAIAKGEIL